MLNRVAAKLIIAFLMPVSFSIAAEEVTDLLELRANSPEEEQGYFLEHPEDLPVNNAQDFYFGPEFIHIYPQYVDNSRGQRKKPLKNFFRSVFGNNGGRSDGRGSQRGRTENRAPNFGNYRPPAPIGQGTVSGHLQVDVYMRPPGYNQQGGWREHMVVRNNGQIKMVALVSTGRVDGGTPSGTYHGIKWFSSHHRSTIYDDSPMPWAMFFTGTYSNVGNIAFHGVSEYYYGALGRPASAGCVRMTVDDARSLWNMAKTVGQRNVTITLHKYTAPPSWEQKYIRSELYKSFQKRDYYYQRYRHNYSRGPYWPSGFWN